MVESLAKIRVLLEDAGNKETYIGNPLIVAQTILFIGGRTELRQAVDVHVIVPDSPPDAAPHSDPSYLALNDSERG